jgi:hypothetical protein
MNGTLDPHPADRWSVGGAQRELALLRRRFDDLADELRSQGSGGVELLDAERALRRAAFRLGSLEDLAATAQSSRNGSA